MEIEGNSNVKYARPVKQRKEVKLPDSPGAGKGERVPDSGLDAEKAHKVAQRLNELSQNSIHFVVRDPTSTKPHNVIIQIENKDGQVVATIPSEVVIKMAEASDAEFRETSKGLMVDQVVS